MKYEMLYIIPATKTDDEVALVKDEVSKLVEKYGQECSRDEALGKLKMAYPIKAVRYGHYVLVCFACEPDTVKALDEELRHLNSVLRHTITKMEEGSDTKEIELSEYEMPDVFQKRKPRVAPKPPVVRKPAPAVASNLSEAELDAKLDKILEADIEKL